MTKTTRASSRKTPVKPTKALIRKSSRSASKTVAKVDTAPKKVDKKLDKKTKKETVSAKVTATITKQTKATKKNTGGSNILELCLLLDCTGSMGSWIQRSKDTLKQIIQQVKEENKSLTVRVCFIGYRDV